jgi:transcriptional regulator with XRE-family HTH domain
MRTAVRRSNDGVAGGGHAPQGARPGKALGDLRRAREITQVELARRLAVSQATVSKFEKSNPAVSTVKRYVEALGGRLEMTAVFDDGRLLLEY